MQLTLTTSANNTVDGSLDQYYTKNHIASRCIDEIVNALDGVVNIGDYLFFEPSAGYGCFYDELKNRGHSVVAFDIHPNHNAVKELDFLDNNLLLKVLDDIDNKNIITIGNPPFGKKSKLAIQFFNQASFFSDLICFILPNQFKKWSVHKQLDTNYKLIYESNLPPNSFYTENKSDYNVNSVFQIWTKLDTPYPDKRIKTRPEITHKDFVMYQYNNTVEALKVFDNDFDFAVFCQGYGDYKTLITKREDFNFKKHYILFKAENKKIIAKLKKIDFEKLSKQNTTVPGFRKNNVITEYVRLYGRPV